MKANTAKTPLGNKSNFFYKKKFSVKTNDKVKSSPSSNNINIPVFIHRKYYSKYILLGTHLFIKLNR